MKSTLNLNSTTFKLNYRDFISQHSLEVSLLASIDLSNHRVWYQQMPIIKVFRSRFGQQGPDEHVRSVRVHTVSACLCLTLRPSRVQGGSLLWCFIFLFACLDIDECQMGTHRCAVGQICHNLPGSYRCDCQTGYQYDALRKVCTGTYRRVRPVKWWRAGWRFSCLKMF